MEDRPEVMAGERNHFIVVTFDSCRFDSFMAAKPKIMTKLGEVERRYSYASWTAPSHYNLLTGLMPHASPQNVYASEYYKKDFVKYNERLGTTDIEFRSLIPHLYFPRFLQSIGYKTYARVSMPVLNPRTAINSGFDSFRLMKKHNDMNAMLDGMEFGDQPTFWLLNVGETHYPYALPSEHENDWPRISGVHGVFKHLDKHVVGGKLKETPEGEAPKFFDQDKLDILRERQIETVRYLDTVVERLFDIVPKNTWIVLTADHGELFGEDGYFGHGPIHHDKVFEVPFLEGKIR